MRKTVLWNTMRNEFGNCSWAIIDNMVVVKTAYGTKSARLDGVPER